VNDYLEMPTSMGLAVAVRQSGDEWLISHPWGDLRFYGTEAQVRAEMARLVSMNEEDETEAEP